MGNYDEVLWYCNEFIKIDPTYREPYFLMADAFNEIGVYTMVEGAVLTGVKYSDRKFDWVESPESWAGREYSILGAVYLNMERYEEASEKLKKALEIEPNNTELLKQYILSLEKQLNKIA